MCFFSFFLLICLFSTLSKAQEKLRGSEVWVGRVVGVFILKVSSGKKKNWESAESCGKGHDQTCEQFPINNWKWKKCSFIQVTKLFKLHFGHNILGALMSFYDDS